MIKSEAHRADIALKDDKDLNKLSFAVYYLYLSPQGDTTEYLSPFVDSQLLSEMINRTDIVISNIYLSHV